MSAKRELWVYIDVDRGELSRSSLEVLAKAGQLLTARTDYALCAVTIGGDFTDARQMRALSGADIWLNAASGELHSYSHLRFAAILERLCRKRRPEIVLFAQDSRSALIEATLGGKLRVGAMAHCVDLRLDEQGLLIGVIPAFGGQMLGEIFCPHSRPQLATLRVAGCEPSYRPAAPTRLIEIEDIAATTGGAVLIEESPYVAAGKAIEDAELIVCGGAGVGSAENWRLMSEVAELLGASLACTRPPIDKGWAEGEQMMIGTSGKYVHPRVYIGCGVSGTAHHLCGMRDSGLIISINNDEEAAIWSASDLGLVGDCAEVLGALKRLLAG